MMADISSSLILKITFNEATNSESLTSSPPLLPFSIKQEEISPIIDAWADYQTLLINNRIVDIQNRLHKEGITVELSASQYNTLMDDEDTLNPNRW